MSVAEDDPRYVAWQDQTQAASRDLANLAVGLYRELRAKGIPKRLAGALVRDVVFAAMTGRQRAE